MTLECVLWDVGDTLADERWLVEAGLEWEASCVRLMDGRMGDQWNRGARSAWDVAQRVADDAGCSTQHVFDDMAGRCRSLSFFPYALAGARSVIVPRALVTVNPDIVSDVVISHYGPAELFDVIVISWQEHTTNQANLCDTALTALNVASRDHAFLIDNRADNVAAWIDRGGQGYHGLVTRGEQVDSTGPSDPHRRRHTRAAPPISGQRDIPLILQLTHPYSALPGHPSHVRACAEHRVVRQSQN